MTLRTARDTNFVGSTVIDDEYKFNSLAEWEVFYRKHKDAIDRKTTKWLNNHISITDGDRRYRIFYRRHKLYLKPFKQLDTAKEKESIQEHQLNLVLQKLDELFTFIDCYSRGSSGTDARDIPQRLPNKSIIERVKELKADKDEGSSRQTTEADSTTRYVVSRFRTIPSTSKH